MVFFDQIRAIQVHDQTVEVARLEREREENAALIRAGRKRNEMGLSELLEQLSPEPAPTMAEVPAPPQGGTSEPAPGPSRRTGSFPPPPLGGGIPS